MGQAKSLNKELELSEIQSLYKTFIMECPSGSLYLHEFKKIFGVKSGPNPESLYLENVFRSFDENGDNTLDFIEYVAALHLVLRGKLEDKLRWSFKVFDNDGNGRLDKDEIARIIRIIYKIKLGNVTDESGNILNAEEVCDRVVERIDENNDGDISLEEFLAGAQRDAWVKEFLSLDVNPSTWMQNLQQIKGNEQIRETLAQCLTEEIM